MCEIHRLNYVLKGISPKNFFLRVFFCPVSEMNEKTESELIDKMKRSGPRCEQNRKCKGTLLYNHLICFWKSAISFLMSFLSFGKTKQDSNWVFLFCMHVQKPFFFFHHLWLTFRDPVLEESELMSLHHLIFSPNCSSKTSHSYFLDVSDLGTSFANAKVKVIYEISNTLSLQMSYTFPLRTWTPPTLHPSAPAFPSTVQHGWIIFISKRRGHHLQCLNDKKIFLERMCQSGIAESQRPSIWYLQVSSLTK